MAALLASAVVAPSPAGAVARFDSARVYLEARAAAIGGNHTRSAQLLAELVDTSSANSTIQREAVSQAISAGDMRLALRLAKNMPVASLPIDARLLQVADALRSNDNGRALSLFGNTGEPGDLSFLRPFIDAWVAADSRDLSRALSTLDALSGRNMLAALVPEHHALILLKSGKIAEADSSVAQALKVGGGRELRLRLAFADAYLALGDRTRALSMADGMGTETVRERDRIMRGQFSGARIDNSRRAFSELLVVLAAELNRLQNETMPVSLSQVARFTAPENSSAAVMLGLMLDRRDRVDDALAALRSVPATDGLAPTARDAEVRALLGAGRKADAVQAAQRAIASGMNSVTDYARLGDALEAVDRHQEAAAAYAQALQLEGSAKPEDRWPLMVLQASALEESNHWPEARAILVQALALAPEEPVILNFLGYARLERGEELDAAEAMIRKASALAPDDASITDSLGWALYKRGRLNEAIEVLSRAAKGDPTQAEIREHLGDALYKAGNRFEARYAWSAALATADDEIATRVKAKLETGLTAASAAP